MGPGLGQGEGENSLVTALSHPPMDRPAGVRLSVPCVLPQHSLSYPKGTAPLQPAFNPPDTGVSFLGDGEP